ncbi:MAG: protein kinase [Planctomycetes bacterium]|nr:protein kinase [Planctomycetota bacterium]
MNEPVAPDAGDDGFADLVDDLLQQIQDGREPDLTQVRRDHPLAAGRVEEAHALARSLVGRRCTPTPVVAGYQIVRELGHGGMGTVYLARHESLAREVALKVLPNTVWQSSRARQRFLAEARALARLQHDHIVRVHRVLEHGGMAAFEMEFVDGPSLQQVLTRLRAGARPPGRNELVTAIGPAASALRERSAIEFFVLLGVRIARALAHAHRAGLVHRDVKPANILLRGDGRPLLADFGLVHGEDTDLTRTGTFVGTPMYAAPEQLRTDAAIDARADVYALGVTLYEAIALEVPFAGRSTAAVLRDIEAGNLLPLRQRARHVPRDLETVLGKAMEADPERRYATAEAFADDLERVLGLQPVLARPAGIARRLLKAVRRNRRSFASALLGAALVLTVVLLLSTWWRAEAAARTRADSAVRSAQLALIDAVGPALHRHTTDPSLPLLTRARAAYDEAMADAPDDRDIDRERAVVAVACWLRAASPQRRDEVRAVADSAALRELTADLPPITTTLVRELVIGRVDRVALAERLAVADRADRDAVGLLGFVLADVALCELGWGGLPITADRRPLQAAGLGLVRLADQRVDRAFVHLFEARTAFPESFELTLQIANAALLSGDPAQAQQWRERLPPAGDDPGRQRRIERLAADLAAAAGDRSTARQIHDRHRRADPTDPVPRHRLAQLALIERDGLEAMELLRELITEQPDQGRCRLELARLALENGDVPTYLEQAVAVVRFEYGVSASIGTRGDLLEILRIGGLDELHAEGLRRTGSVPRPDSGLTRPIWPRLPATLRTALQHAITARAAAMQRRQVRRPTWADELAAELRFATAGVHAVGGAAPWGVWLTAVLAERVLAHWPLWPTAPAPWRGQSGQEFVRPVAAGAEDPNLVFAQAIDWLRDVHREPVLLVGSPPFDAAQSLGMVQVCDRRGAVLAEIEGEQGGLLFGFDVAGVGDVDGDGADDWLIGAPLGRSAGAGRAYLYSGTTQRLLHEWQGQAAGFGVAVAGVGDWDGDGSGDVAIGVSPELRNLAALGEVLISSAGGRELAVLRTDRSGCWFGSAIAVAGDVDGDGRNDLVVGGNHGQAPGVVCVFASGSGRRLWTWSDDASTTSFGAAVCGADDIDLDGHADIAVAAPGAGSDSPGRVLIRSGADGRLLREYRGGRGGDLFGSWIASAGDVDGDGVGDLAVAALRGGGAGGGAVHLFSGRTGNELFDLGNATANSTFATRVALTAGWLAIAGAAREGHGALFITAVPARVRLR